MATALLLASAAGLALALWQGGADAGSAWSWLRAGCEAALIGGLADWFAVVALFRRPLGLPIWHTAIVPRNKDRIADSLAAFVRDHFLSPDALLAQLQRVDLAAHLAQGLRQPQQLARLLGLARSLALDALDTVDDQRLQQALLGQVRRAAQQWDAATTLGELLDLLADDPRHQQLLDQALRLAADWVARDAVQRAVGRRLHQQVHQALPTAMTWLDKVASTEALAHSLAQRLSASAQDELHQVLQRADHPLRQRYAQELAAYVQRLRHDEALRQRIGHWKQQALDDPAVKARLGRLWTRGKRRLRAQLSREDSALAAALHQRLSQLGQHLADSPALREALNPHLVATAAHLAHQLPASLASHIAQTLKSWDDRQLVQQIEGQLGRDLQFIRINGTVVGGLAGLALHALQRWG